MTQKFLDIYSLLKQKKFLMLSRCQALCQGGDYSPGWPLTGCFPPLSLLPDFLVFHVGVLLISPPPGLWSRQANGRVTQMASLLTPPPLPASLLFPGLQVSGNTGARVRNSRASATIGSSAGPASRGALPPASYPQLASYANNDAAPPTFGDTIKTIL